MLAISLIVEHKTPTNRVLARIRKPTGSVAIAAVPSVGFRVCQLSTFVEEGTIYPCIDVVNSRLSNLTHLEQAGVRTVRISPPRIDLVRCVDENSNACSGFLEEWITNGQFNGFGNTLKTIPCHN